MVEEAHPCPSSQTVSDGEVASALHVQQTALDLVDNVSAVIQKTFEQSDVSREREFHVK